MKSLLYGFIFLAASFSSAEDKPAWVDRLPAEDSEYRYYIGRSMDASSEDLAFNQATINAREQAITQNFGLFVQIKTETYQNTTDSISTQNSEAISQQVQLQEFEQVDFYKINYEEKKLNVWLLFRYRKSAIQAEKNRLKGLSKNNNENFSIMTSGNQENAKISGTLEVTSFPTGAPVRIDGKHEIGDLELRTPLRLMGLFSAGKHTIEIDHPDYDPYQQDIILYPGVTSKVDAKLNRAVGAIAIEASVPGATVFLGSKIIGTTPLSEAITVFSGTVVSIELRHSEMKPFQAQVEVPRNETETVYAKMEPLDSFLSLTSTPPKAAVSIDGMTIDQVTPTGLIKVSHGAHIVRISKGGYVTQEVNLTIKGGEKMVVPRVALKVQKNAILKGISSIGYADITLNGKKIESDIYEKEIAPDAYELIIKKAGYYDYKQRFVLNEAEVFDLNSITLKKIPTSVERLTHPTFSLGLGAFFSNPTVDSRRAGISAIGGSLRVNFFSRLGIEGSYFGSSAKIDNPQRTQQIPDTRESDVLRLGLPLTIYRPGINSNDGLNIIPEVIQLKTTFSNKMIQAQKIEFPSLTEKQNARGLSLEYRIYGEPEAKSSAVLGFSIRAGVHKYQESSAGPEKKVPSFALEFLIGF